jgi:hypothetical protein
MLDGVLTVLRGLPSDAVFTVDSFSDSYIAILDADPKCA